jgi:hypothetical protein
VRLDPVDEPHDLGLELGERARATPSRASGRSRAAPDRLEQPDRQLAALLPQLLEQRFEDRDEGVGFLGEKSFICGVSSS